MQLLLAFEFVQLITVETQSISVVTKLDYRILLEQKARFARPITSLLTI